MDNSSAMRLDIRRQTCLPVDACSQIYRHRANARSEKELQSSGFELYG